MASESVSPLRIQKNNSSSSLPKPSPTKMAKALQEISPMGVRRNSPSFNQAFKGPAFKGDSSPFDASPENKSPRSFWKTRESASPTRFGASENSLQPTPSQRQSSIERLQKASRVKNSNIYARVTENGFDPDSSIMSDRSFLGKPLSGQAFLGKNTSQPNSAQSSPSKGHRRMDSQTSIPTLSPTKSNIGQASPMKSQLSPGKSSLSSTSRFAEASTFQTEAGVWSDDEDVGSRTPRGTLRHPKSVSFDQGPPQINEYEEITPDPSSVASGSREGSYDDDDEYDMDLSFERGSSAEHEDSFDHSLEDTEKTPVVLPEDWRFMSPEAANTDLADTFDDPFERDESVDRPSSSHQNRGFSRSLSVTSDGEPRPLPPLPTSKSPSASEEVPANSGSRSNTPLAPRPASISKDDILKMQSNAMPLEERLRRLSVQNQHAAPIVHSHDENDADEPTLTLGETDKTAMDLPTQQVEVREISSTHSSREPSLRRMKSQSFDQAELQKYADLDPDVPIPSREASSNYEDEVTIKKEHDAEREVIDMYALPEAQFNSRHSSPFGDDFGRESSVVRHDIQIYEDEEPSQMDEGTPKPEVSDGVDKLNNENAAPAGDLQLTKQKDQEHEERKMSLPEFSGFSDHDSFGFGLETYMTPSPPIGSTAESKKGEPQSSQDSSASAYDDEQLSELAAPPPVFESTEHEEVGTPESVIRRSPLESLQESPVSDEDASIIPQPMATIKASGGKLKTRVSASTAELEALRDQEIHTSSEAPPAIPDEYRDEMSIDRESSTHKRPHRRQSQRMTIDMSLGSWSDDLGLGMDKEFDRLLEAQKVDLYPLPTYANFPIPGQDGKITTSPHDPFQDSNNAEHIPGQGFSPQGTQADLRAHRKRGYLMRQNTKVVVATNRTFSNEKPPEASVECEAAAAPTPAVKDRETRSAGNSPRKPSGPTVTTEPWNGKVRRHSTRKSMIVNEKPMQAARQSMGGAQADGMEALMEDQQSFLEPEAGAERGRFFVKVMGVKNLNMPLPRNERTNFQLTLDNGLHCVTTAWLELGKNAQIGQEFELTVFDELDFSLTLQTKLDRPVSQASVASQASSLESPKKKEKQSALSRLLASPKKRREAERKQQEEQAEQARQRQREIQAQRASAQPTAWDLLHNLVGPDGSFAQSIVSLDDFEEQAFGRPIVTDVPCYNNWAVEDSFASTKSKHGGVQRKPPYQIGNLTLQLLYIPKPKGVADEDMPQSMSAAVKQLKEAEANSTRSFEGPLSQQGGDCPYWRRRFFKLNGSILTAYHEATRQRRANIRLAKATKLIDDRSALTQNETSAKGGKGRRRSAFATDTEGYMFVEEGFRIVFANGDTIDFYADTRQQKEEWMDHLSNVIGKDFSADKPTWTSAVLALEKSKGVAPAPQQQPSPARPAPQPATEAQNPLRSNPPSPTKPASPSKQASPSKAARHTMLAESKPAPIEKSPRHSLQSSPRKPVTGRTAEEPTPRQSGSANSGRRKAVRSMIF